MKKALALLALAAILLAGCASTQPIGILYQNLKVPAATGPAKGAWTKRGVAISHSYLGVMAVGDSSIASACANADIKEVVYVDWEVENFLGIYATYKCRVYGN